MKHVWILNHYAQEPGGAGGTRHFSLARNLRDHGWDATIIAASVDHATGRRRLSPDVGSATAVYSGVRFLFVGTTRYTANGPLRILSMVQYTYRALRKRTTQVLGSPDLVIGSSVHPMAAWAAKRLAARFGVPFVFEVRDLWPQTLIDFGRLRPNSVPAVLMRLLEANLYRCACRILTLMPRAGDYIQKYGVPRDKISWLPNGVDLAFDAAGRSDAQPADGPVKQSAPFTLMYLGALGQANAMENIIRAFAGVDLASLPVPVRLRVVGDGPMRHRLLQMASDFSLRNVTFEPPVPKAEVPDLASQADAFVIAVRNLPGLYRYGISMNKIYDYMAAGRPVLISSSSANNPIRAARCGIAVPADRPAALTGAIEAIVRMPRRDREEMGRRGRRFVEKHHDYRHLALKLAEYMDECIST